MRVNPISFNYFNIPKSFSNKSFIKTDLPCDTVSFGANDYKSQGAGKRQGKNRYTVENCLRDLKYDIINDKFQNIFRYFGVETNKINVNRLIISHYSQPSDDFTFRNLGIDEEKLFENVIRIKGDADFRRTSLTDTKNVKHIWGDCDISRSGIKSFPKLSVIEGNLEAQSSLLKNFGALKTIGGDADCSFCPLNNMNALEYVGGNLDLTGNYRLNSLGNLQHVGGDLYIADSNVKKAKYLKEVGGKIYLNERQFNAFKDTMPKDLVEKFVVVLDKTED